MTPDPEGHFAPCACGGSAVLAAGESERHPAAMFELANIDAFLVSLARTLSTALGRRVTLRADGGRVVHFQLELGSDVFTARRDGDGLIGEHRRPAADGTPEIRTHALDRWVELLKKALAVYATENVRAAQAKGIQNYGAVPPTPAPAEPPKRRATGPAKAKAAGPATKAKAAGPATKAPAKPRTGKKR